MTPKSADDISGLHILGTSLKGYKFKEPNASILEAFPNRFKERDYIIRIEFPEFTSLCPKTGQPDFATICAEYIPDELCVESKSFKLYMFAYRSHQSFMETITNNIMEDLINVLSPRWILVKGLFNPRGATRLHVFAENFKNLPPERECQIRQTVALWRSSADAY